MPFTHDKAYGSSNLPAPILVLCVIKGPSSFDDKNPLLEKNLVDLNDFHVSLPGNKENHHVKKQPGLDLVLAFQIERNRTEDMWQSGLMHHT